MKISVCSPSYKRSKSILTKRQLPGAVKYYVHPDELKDYRKHNPNETIVACADGVQGNIARVRNHILDTEFKAGAEAVCIIDDDFGGLFYWEVGESYKVRAHQFLPILEKYTLLCQEFGFKFWGVNVNQDKQVYREYSPFSTVSFIGAPFGVTLKSSRPRYDERIPLKEDYDMTLQHCNLYRGNLRVNKFYYKVKQSEQPGGVASMRNFDKEAEQLALLVKKWGKRIVKSDTNDRSHNLKGSKKQIDYNPIIKIPIGGI